MSFTRSELYGESIFTSFRSVNGIIPKLELHLKRLFKSVNEYYFANKMAYEDFNKTYIAPLQLDQATSLYPNHYFRITFTADKQKEMVPTDFGVDQVKVQLSTSELKHKNKLLKLKTFQSPYSVAAANLKSGSYFQNFYFRQKALRDSFDDALFLRGDEVLEATTSNIVFFKDNEWIAPSSDGIFPGIGQSIVQDFCLHKNLELTYRKIFKDDLALFQGAFLINSVSFLMSVKQVDGIIYTENQPQRWEREFDNFIFNNGKV